MANKSLVRTQKAALHRLTVRFPGEVNVMQFELEHLESYTDEALLAELRRVAALIKTPKITIGQFTALAKVHGSTMQKRFGGWKGALQAAGLGNRFDDGSFRKGREEILDAIRAVAVKLKKDALTFREFQENTGITYGPIKRIFSSWRVALSEAGICQSAFGKRYTDDECFENMLTVWTHYGRPPQHDEMNRAPSIVGSKAYTGRWGTWRKALSAFVQRINEKPSQSVAASVLQPTSSEKNGSKPQRGPRDIPLSLRYNVLKRDNFRCVTCGASPALSPGVVLHIDHIIPWARGGPTIAENLRTLCQACNLGKGKSPA